MRYGKEHPLKRAIYDAGYNCDTFAQYSGVSRRTLMDIFKGHRKTRVGTIDCIAEALNISYTRAEILCNAKDEE